MNIITVVMMNTVNPTFPVRTQIYTYSESGGTSVMSVVGVALETFRELEAQMTLRNYKGFLD